MFTEPTAADAQIAARTAGAEAPDGVCPQMVAPWKVTLTVAQPGRRLPRPASPR